MRRALKTENKDLKASQKCANCLLPSLQGSGKAMATTIASSDSPLQASGHMRLLEINLGTNGHSCPSVTDVSMSTLSLCISLPRLLWCDTLEWVLSEQQKWVGLWCWVCGYARLRYLLIWSLVRIYFPLIAPSLCLHTVEGANMLPLACSMRAHWWAPHLASLFCSTVLWWVMIVQIKFVLHMSFWHAGDPSQWKQSPWWGYKDQQEQGMGKWGRSCYWHSVILWCC